MMDLNWTDRLRELYRKIKGDGLLKLERFPGSDAVRISTVEIDADDDGRARDFGHSVIEGRFTCETAEERRDIGDFLELLFENLPELMHCAKVESLRQTERLRTVQQCSTESGGAARNDIRLRSLERFRQESAAARFPPIGVGRLIDIVLEEAGILPARQSSIESKEAH